MVLGDGTQQKNYLHIDDAIRAAFCHHCENYIALMEYYAPSEHCMEATTRT